MFFLSKSVHLNNKVKCSHTR